MSLSRVNNPQGDLEKLTVLIKVNWVGGGTTSATGYLIDNTHVLTAAHCIDTRSGSSASGAIGVIDSIEVTPAYDGGLSPTVITASSWQLYPGYSVSQSDQANLAFDMGVITLSSGVGYDNREFIGLSAFYEDAGAANRNVDAFGYPTDFYDADSQNGDDDGITNIIHGQMHKTDGSTFIAYAADNLIEVAGSLSRPGQSGSAFISNYSNTAQDQVGTSLYTSFIMGVGSYRAGSTEFGGLYLTADKLDWVMDILETTNTNPDLLPYNYIFGSQSSDAIAGTYRRDVITTNGGADGVSALGGDDILHSSTLNIAYDGGAGHDTICLTSNFSGAEIDIEAGTIGNVGYCYNVENVIGTSGSDRITVTAANNFISGADGNDQFFVAAGEVESVLHLGDGADAVNIEQDGGIIILDPSPNDIISYGLLYENIAGFISTANRHEYTAEFGTSSEVWWLEHEDYVNSDVGTDPRIDGILVLDKFTEGDVSSMSLTFEWFLWSGNAEDNGSQELIDSGGFYILMPEFSSGDFGIYSQDSLTIASGEERDTYINFIEWWMTDPATSSEDNSALAFFESDHNWDALLAA